MPSKVIETNPLQDFHLNVSLFERMIVNGFPFVSLAEQHRMRPSVAAVVSRVFYPQLRNHPTVERYPDIRSELLQPVNWLIYKA